MTPRHDKGAAIIPSPNIERPGEGEDPGLDSQLLDSVVDHFSPPTPVVISVASASSSLANSPSHSHRQEITPSTSSATQEQQGSQQQQSSESKIVMSSNNVTDLLATDNKHTYFGIEMPFDVVSAAYAALVATGGVIGYLKAGSIPSLAAGLSFGSVLGIGAYLTSVNPDNYYLTFGTSAVLGSLMGYRFVNSGKFMPAGLIAILSLGMVIRYSVLTFTQTKSHSR